MYCLFRYAVIVYSFTVLKCCHIDVKCNLKLQTGRMKNCFKATATSPGRDHRKKGKIKSSTL